MAADLSGIFKVIMHIPTEPIGSIPRPLALIEAIRATGDGTDPSLEALYDEAIRDTIKQFEATGPRDWSNSMGERSG